jgi:hypothetical protein
METSHFADHVPRRKTPWNKGKFTGAKPPLQPKHVCAIRTRLQIASRTRDLVLFNIAIDGKLRGCDVVGLKVEDVAPHTVCRLKRFSLGCLVTDSRPPPELEAALAEAGVEIVVAG